MSTFAGFIYLKGKFKLKIEINRKLIKCLQNKCRIRKLLQFQKPKIYIYKHTIQHRFQKDPFLCTHLSTVGGSHCVVKVVEQCSISIKSSSFDINFFHSMKLLYFDLSWIDI